jgi:hypothetical protein
VKLTTLGLVSAFVATIAVTWIFSARYQAVLTRIAALEDQVIMQQGVIATQADVIERLVTALIAAGFTPEQVQDIVDDALRNSGGGPAPNPGPAPSAQGGAGGGNGGGAAGEGNGNENPPPPPDEEPPPEEPPLVCLPEPIGCVPGPSQRTILGAMLAAWAG